MMSVEDLMKKKFDLMEKSDTVPQSERAAIEKQIEDLDAEILKLEHPAA